MIVITGASDGLGLQVAKLYKEAGKTVVNISRNKSEYADANISLSLREGTEIEKAAQEILKMNEPLEHIINCIGIYSRESFDSITEDEIKRLMSTNLKAPLLLVSNLFERIKNDQTDILNVICDTETVKNNEPVYSASKWAARGYTKSLQEELKDTPCRVISFCPDGIKTNFFKKVFIFDVKDEHYMDPAAVAKLIKQILDLPKNMEVSEIILKGK